MAAVKFDDIQKHFASKNFLPIYLLSGEEDYFVDILAKKFETEILDESQNEFDLHIYYGLDLKKSTPYSFGDVIKSCTAYPLTGQYQVIIIKEAQNISKWEPLELYAKNPVPSTILVICYKHGKVDKRKVFYKNIEKTGVTFQSDPLQERSYPTWIENYLKERGYKIKPVALRFLLDAVPRNLNLIVNELQKFTLNFPQGSEIDEKNVSDYIGINRDYNITTFQKAIAERDIVTAQKIVNYFNENSKEFPIFKLMYPLLYFFNKLLLYHALVSNKFPQNELASRMGVAPYFMNEYTNASRYYSYSKTVQIIEILREFDLKSKGVGGSFDNAELLNEMIFRILH
ncbi:MAG: DNA polymerase III subunit delta [Bacteroidales bacterium]|jgi:DNA polymerase-3 subunit delta|nr:DNA polymerase III subunit delta [Bacteroidales bacterium]